MYHSNTVAALTSPLAAWAMDSPLGRRGAIIMYGTIAGLSVFGAFFIDLTIPENPYSRWFVMFARVLVILVSFDNTFKMCIIKNLSL